MGIRAPQALPRRTPSVSPLQFALGVGDIQKVANDLRELKDKHEAEHQATLEKIAADHHKKMSELDARIAEIQHHVTVVHKGDPGKDAPPVDEYALEERIYSRIRQPKDGDTPVIDTEAIARKAAKLIVVPKVKDGNPGKDADPKEVASLVVDILKKDKPLKMEHIDGLSRTIESYRAQLAGKHYGETTMARGGGDVVKAGNNITISVDADGKKVIASTGGSGSGYQAPTSGAIDGINTVFTFATAPNVIVADQGRAMQKVSSDTTINWTGTTTITLTVAPTFDLYATA